jgi:hypothetical protein
VEADRDGEANNVRCRRSFPFGRGPLARVMLSSMNAKRDLDFVPKPAVPAFYLGAHSCASPGRLHSDDMKESPGSPLPQTGRTIDNRVLYTQL